MTDIKIPEAAGFIEFLEKNRLFLKREVIPLLIFIKDSGKKLGQKTDKIEQSIYEITAEVQRLTESIQKFKEKKYQQKAGDA
jgi:hypothetical protein